MTSPTPTHAGEPHPTESRMVIVHLITCLLCGGSEKQLQQVILASDRDRFRHIVIQLREDGPLAPELRAAGIEVYSLGMSPGLPSLAGMIRLVRLLRQCKPDLLHCWLYHACLMGLIGGSLVRVPRIIWGLRTAHLEMRDFTFMTRCVIRLCASLSVFVERIVVNSEASAQVHRQLGYAGKKLKVIPNGVDLQRFCPDSGARASVREELGLADDALLVGMVARFDPMKDHGTFLRAAALAGEHCPQARFLLAGEGISKDNAQLARLLDQNGLRERCHLLGQRYDIARVTAALDLACLSSWTESSPNVVVEAMASAVPCVVTDVGDAPILVGDTGKIVPPRDPQAMAKAMGALIALAPSERRALGQSARKRVVSQFTLQRTVAGYEDIYSQSVDKNTAKPA